MMEIVLRSVIFIYESLKDILKSHLKYSVRVRYRMDFP